MPRKPRFYLPNIPAHVMQRGHNRHPIFFVDRDYRQYLKILKIVADQCECQIHAYVLMTNHVHLLLTPSSQKSISQLFQSLGRQYVSYINKTYQRSGTLWEGRHKGNIIDSKNYFLICMQYIELNPIRANMVTDLGDYFWSSYAANGLGSPNAILTPHSEYLSLAKEHSKRLRIYNDLLKSNIKPSILNDLNESLQSGTPLGKQYFIKEIEKLWNCKIGQIKQGRPSKQLL